MTKKTFLSEFFETTEEFDKWLMSLKPGEHARISNSGHLVVKPYKTRKVQIGGGRFFIKRR